MSPYVLPRSPSFVALDFPLLLSFALLLSCIPQNFSIDNKSSWFLPESFRILSTTLSHLIPARPLVIFFHTALSALCWQPFFFWYSLLYIAFSTFSRLYFIIKNENPLQLWYILSSTLSSVLLVVFEHPCTFLAAEMWTVSSCFTNFVFSSHTPPAYSSFDAITLIRTHLSVIVSRR